MSRDRSAARQELVEYLASIDNPELLSSLMTDAAAEELVERVEALVAAIVEEQLAED